MTTARFKITGSTSGLTLSAARGHDAVNGETLTFQLEDSPALDVQSALFTVEQLTKNAPAMVISNSGIPTPPTGTVTASAPASGAHSYMVRCTIVTILGELIFERIISVRTSGTGIRKIVPAERDEYHPTGGWAFAQNEMVDEVEDAFASGGGSNAWAAAQGDVTGLRALGAGAIADRQNRFVESIGNGMWHDANSGANEADDGEFSVKPDHIAIGSNGRWRVWGYRLAVGTSVLAGLTAISGTFAAAGAQQYSPAAILRGHGWKTDATAASQPVDFALQTRPVQGAAAPSGEFHCLSQINGGGWTSQFKVTSAGDAYATRNAIAVAFQGNVGQPTIVASDTITDRIRLRGGASTTLAEVYDNGGVTKFDFAARPVQLVSSNSVLADGGAFNVRTAAGVDRFTITTGTAMTWTLSPLLTSFVFQPSQHGSAAGFTMTVRGQQGTPGFIGGIFRIGGGDGGTPGTNLAGATEVVLGQPVSNVSARFKLVDHSFTTLLEMYQNASESVLINGPVGNVQLNAASALSLTSAAASVGIGASSLVQVASQTNFIYFASCTSSGTPQFIWRGNGDALVRTDTMPHAGACSQTWAATVTGVALNFTAKGTDAAPASLTLSPQAPWASATGTNRTPGDLILDVPLAVGGGIDSGVSIRWAGTEHIFAARGSNKAFLQAGSSISDFEIGTKNTTTNIIFKPGTGVVYSDAASVEFRHADGTARLAFTQTTSPSMNWNGSSTAVSLSYDAKASDVATGTFSIITQAPFGSASTNVDSGHFDLMVPNPVSTGKYGQIRNSWGTGNNRRTPLFCGQPTATSNATPTVIAAFTLPDNTVAIVTSRAVGRNGGTGSCGSFMNAATVRRHSGGGATLEGSVTSLHAGTGMGGGSATLVVSSNDIQLQVTGIGSTTINWLGWLDVWFFTP